MAMSLVEDDRNSGLAFSLSRQRVPEFHQFFLAVTNSLLAAIFSGNRQLYQGGTHLVSIINR